MGAKTSKVQSGDTVAAAADKLTRTTSALVVVRLEIINKTMWPLSNPTTHVHGGVVESQPVQVDPASKEMMVMRKTHGTPFGSYGTVSWNVNGKEVLVMWSAPFNFELFSNTLAVGIAPEGEHTISSFDEMYYKTKEYFVREEYLKRTQDVSKSDLQICVEGRMSTTHYPVVRIVVYPVDDDDLAENLKRNRPCKLL